MSYTLLLEKLEAMCHSAAVGAHVAAALGRGGHTVSLWEARAEFDKVLAEPPSIEDVTPSPKRDMMIAVGLR